MKVESKYEFGDCRELMKKLDSKSIKMAVTSPPYNLKKSYGLYADNVHIEEWKELIDGLSLIHISEPTRPY